MSKNKEKTPADSTGASPKDKKKDQSLADVLREHGFDFEAKLAKVIIESDELNEKLHKRVMNNRARGKMRDRDLLLYKNNRQDLMGALRSLTQYVYPKLKTVEAEGTGGQQPTFNIVIGGDDQEEKSEDQTPSDNVINLVRGK